MTLPLGSNVTVPLPPPEKVTVVGSSSVIASSPPESTSVSLLTRSTVRSRPSRMSTVSPLATGGRLTIVTDTLTTVVNPPGSATVTVKLEVPSAAPSAGPITRLDGSCVTHAGAPERAVIVKASASEARSVTRTTPGSPRNALIDFGAPTGSWLTSIVTVPLARSRQVFTTE